MSELYLGVLSDTDTRFEIDIDLLKAHTFITGQSGCGKSSVMSRLIEEIILRKAGNVILFDYNYEFSKFDQEDPDAFNQVWNRNNCDENQFDVFRNIWATLNSHFEILKADSLNIRYDELSSDQKANLFGIDRNHDAGTYWLIQVTDEWPQLSSRITSKSRLRNYAADVDRWFEGRLKKEDDELGEVIYQLRQHVNMLDLTKYSNGSKRIAEQKYINFKNFSEKVNLDDGFFKKLFEDTIFCSIDMLNFKYEDSTIRDFIALHTLSKLWHEAKERFKASKEISDSIDNQSIFVVIDEAHNIIPVKHDADSAINKEIVRLIQTIAAEGRKFGLYLVLISQRPNKISENVLSECDNFIVMKSTPPTIEMLKDILPIKKEKKNQIDESFGFDPGQAFYCGKFTKYEPIKVDGDIKRTK